MFFRKWREKKKREEEKTAYQLEFSSIMERVGRGEIVQCKVCGMPLKAGTESDDQGRALNTIRCEKGCTYYKYVTSY